MLFKLSVIIFLNSCLCLRSIYLPPLQSEMNSWPLMSLFCTLTLVSFQLTQPGSQLRFSNWFFELMESFQRFTQSLSTFGVYYPLFLPTNFLFVFSTKFTNRGFWFGCWLLLMVVFGLLCSCSCSDLRSRACFDLEVNQEILDLHSELLLFESTLSSKFSNNF